MNLCERGNTWLTDGENHVAWFKHGDDVIEVSVTPGNFPGFMVSTLDAEHSRDEAIAQHINENLQGWWVLRCNTPGVEIENGEVVTPSAPAVVL